MIWGLVCFPAQSLKGAAENLGPWPFRGRGGCRNFNNYCRLYGQLYDLYDMVWKLAFNWENPILFAKWSQSQDASAVTWCASRILGPQDRLGYHIFPIKIIESLFRFWKIHHFWRVRHIGFSLVEHIWVNLGVCWFLDGGGDSNPSRNPQIWIYLHICICKYESNNVI